MEVEGAETTVLVPIGNGSEEIEAATIVDVLRRAGAIVTVASVETDLVCTMSRQMKFVADCHIEECTDKTYDMIVLPGGMPGAERLRDSQPLINLLKAQRANRKRYAAICAAPAVVLKPHGLLGGVACTAHPGFTSKIMKLMSKGDCTEGRVVIDEGVTTSRGPGTALEFALCLAQQLFGDQKAKEVAEPLMIPPTERPDLFPREWPGLYPPPPPRPTTPLTPEPKSKGK
mmetsp:Transcript_18872/g.41344  ORF Transcript_18872/g.41344 Transcript_18872/m.41344 type:complete len:230 (-) Transcript_18872:455-1144(-)|eukprot:CAMPEP_0118948822 /NCGR_PEP_ID=MMETSP1169-20130426/48518_1 /TAXON_ID=36882 /ORGANISM="Pyramimonas obovata, Strain CCMP722" /LENGTH=229 /DNA_ID=CAMNT_0006895337 /DNA_START=111 /DNA_END=800 /DNA_ORIENTATION=-